MKHLLPERELSVEDRPLKPLALPDSEVSVLDWKLIKGGRQRAREGIIEGREFSQEDTQRPGIRDDMMHAEEEEEGVVRESEKRGAEQRARSEVEGESGFRGGKQSGLLMGRLLRIPSQVMHLNFERSRRSYYLNRMPFD